MKKLFITLMLPAVLIACSKDEKPSKPDKLTDAEGIVSFHQQDAQLITIHDMEDKVVAGAQVLIGDAQDIPFKGNFLTVNEAGQVALPVSWTTPQSVTVSAPGYVRVSYVNQQPSALTFKLRKQASDKIYEVNGVTAKQPIEDFDGFLDFGLVMPAFSKTDLLSFDLNAAISPQKDTITTLGQTVKLPSNLSMEKQKESYAIFTVTLEKPSYRIYFDRPQQAARVFAARGRMPFRPVVDALRSGKNFVDILNLITLTGGGMRDTAVLQDKTTLDIPVQEFNFGAPQNVKAPVFQENETFLGIGVSEQSGYMVPTDFKRFQADDAFDLTTLPGTNNQLLGLLKKTEDLEAENTSDQLSAALVPFAATGSTSPRMLPMIAKPAVTDAHTLAFPRLNAVSGIAPLATYSVLSQLTVKMDGTRRIENVHNLWEVYAPSWVSGPQKIPQWPNDTLIPAGSKRWGLSFVGNQNTSQPAVQMSMGPDIIKDATHVTHNSIDF